ncbi:MAG: hypothetical protein AAF937_11230 [Planctomycetota bacterium]
MAKQAIKKSSDPIETIAESKLSRVETIAREALDILGEEAPDDLRRSVAEVRAQHAIEIAGLTDRLDKAGAKVSGLKKQLKAAERLAQDRFRESEEVWELANRHASDLAIATKDLQTARDELDFLRVTAESRGREIFDLNAKSDALTTELAQLRAKTVSLEAALAESESSNATLSDDLAAARQRVDALGTAIDAASREASRRIESLETEVAAAQTALAEQVARAEAAVADLDEAREQVDMLEEANDERVARIESLTADLAATRDQLAERGSQLSDAEQRSQAAREGLAEAVTELAETADARDEAMADLRERSSELATLRRELAEATQRLADRDRQLADLLEGASLAEEHAEPQPEPDRQPEPEPHETLEDIARLQSELESQRVEIATFRGEMDRADERADRFATQADRAERSLEKARALVRRARRRSSKRNVEFTKLVHRLTSMRIRCENLEARVHAEVARGQRLLQIAVVCGGTAVLGVAAAILL